MIALRLLALASAYILGAIPFGVIVSKLWRGIDIRQYGSGNIGATNVFRVLGPVPGALVMLADVGKGWAAIWLARELFGFGAGEGWWLVGVAMAAIVGHNWSVFLGMQGGKGVNTSLGVVLGLDWTIALMSFGIWLVILAITRIVSVSSMLATLGFAILLFVFHRPLPILVFGVIAFVFSVYRHRSNIGRLLAGTEPKFGQRAPISAPEGDPAERPQ